MDGWTKENRRMDGGTGGWTGGDRRMAGGTGGWTGGRFRLSRNSILKSNPRVVESDILGYIIKHYY